MLKNLIQAKKYSENYSKFAENLNQLIIRFCEWQLTARIEQIVIKRENEF